MKKEIQRHDVVKFGGHTLQVVDVIGENLHCRIYRTNRFITVKAAEVVKHPLFPNGLTFLK